MTVGERIRQTRIAKDLSQTELAERARYSDKTRISKIEHAGNDISMKQVRRLAKALDVTAAYLMGWEDGPAVAVTEPGVPHFVELPGPYEFDEEGRAATELYEKYKKASPEVQSAIELLLKSVQ